MLGGAAERVFYISVLGREQNRHIFLDWCCHLGKRHRDTGHRLSTVSSAKRFGVPHVVVTLDGRLDLRALDACVYPFFRCSQTSTRRQENWAWALDL